MWQYNFNYDQTIRELPLRDSLRVAVPSSSSPPPPMGEGCGYK